MHSRPEGKVVDVVVSLAEVVPENPGGVAAAYLEGGEQKVQALDHVPHLRGPLFVELSALIINNKLLLIIIVQ